MWYLKISKRNFQTVEINSNGFDLAATSTRETLARDWKKASFIK